MSTRDHWLSLILALGGAGLLGVVPSITCAQNPQSDLLRAENLYRTGAWSEAAEVFLRVKEETPTAATPDLERRRRLCLSRLIEIHRRQGNYQDALQFALDERDLQRLQLGPDTHDELQRNALIIAECHSALSDYPAAETVLRDLLADRCGPVKKFPKFQALVELAVLDQLMNRTDESATRWREANLLGRELWSRFRKSLSQEASTILLQRLLECQEALGDDESASKFATELLDDNSDSRSRSAARTVRVFLELGTRAALRGDTPHAIVHLREALKHFNDDKPSRQRAQAHQLLAQLLRKQGQTEQARVEQSLAVEQLERLLNDLRSTSATKLTDLKQLRSLYLALDRPAQAAEVGEKLLARQIAELGHDHPQTLESRIILGSLSASLEDEVKALRFLSQAAESLRRSSRSRTELAQVLNNLGTVERSLGDFAEASRHFKEAITLREQDSSVDPLDLATSYNNLANVYVAQAKFSDAIELYNKASARCVQRGRREDGLRSVLLLNLATAYKSQGQRERAAKYCQESLALLIELEGQDTLSAVGHYNMLATLARGQGRLTDANSWIQKTLAVCAAHPKNPRAAAAEAGARIQLGMISCLAKDYRLATEHWQNALEIQQKHRQAAQIPSTLNLLGVLAYQQQDYPAAQKFLEQADAAQKASGSTPQDRYNTLCNLAAVYHQNQRTQEAITLLEQAISIPETIRLETFGEAEFGRAKFLAQFASAYEMLVQWHLEANHLNSAFLVAERSRNRTFLDQLNLAGVELLSTLPEKDQTLEREQRLQLHRLRQQARRAAEQPDSAVDLAQIMKELRAAESAYAQLFNKLRDSSPVYRQLLTQDQKIASLDELRESLGPETLCLFYHLGSQRSDVLVIGNDQQQAIRVSLEVTATQTKRLPELPWLHGSAMELTQRGVAGVQETEKGHLEPDQDVPQVNAGPLTRRQVADLVAWYRQALSQSRFDSQRGVGGIVETTKGEKVSDTAFTTLTDILFPVEVRRQIQQRRPKTIVVIPDGALHNLPFEALLLSAGKEPRFVLDEFPPIAYVPSANILANLRHRPEAPAENLRRLLTVGPRYGTATNDIATTSPQKKPPTITEVKAAAVPTLIAQSDLTRDLFEGLGPLPELKGAKRECERLESSFKLRGLEVLPLLDDDATESRFTSVVSGHGIVHLAAHGLVDEQYGNLFGRIALSHGSDDEGDGFLMYNEILDLKLGGCELAVLSACQTNVGPNRPLEAGSTLAQAFLAAGARRVVASQWSVSDASTTELVATFLESVADSVQESRSPSYAAALHEAKRHVRRDERWAAPYFWASFILLGPNE